MDLKNIYGKIIFSAAVETMKELVLAAIKVKINLSGSDLSGSDLSGSNLRYSNLSGSNLRYSDLSGSNLSGSDLSGSDLRYSNLRYSNLSGSNLSGSNLSGSNLSGSDLSGSDLSGSNLRYSNLSGSDLPTNFPVARLDFGGWSILVTATHTTIGCQPHPNAKWLKWSPKDVAAFAEDASHFWAQHQTAIKAVIKDVQKRSKKS